METSLYPHKNWWSWTVTLRLHRVAGAACCYYYYSPKMVRSGRFALPTPDWQTGALLLRNERN